ncbi:MAG: sigma-70 family RNA polymerase sigma factor, partial [Bacteroidota bacterium]
MDAVLNFREKAIKGKITYMTRIRNYIYTTCLNMYRVNYAKQQRAREKTEEVLMYFQDDTVVEETDQEGEDERQQVVIRAFKKLDEKCRCILKSYYVHHHKMSEIAKELGFTNANVAKTAKSRCYKKWIKEIKKMNESYIDITSSK